MVDIRQSWQHFSGPESCPRVVQKKMCYSSTRQCMSLHVMGFTRPSLANAAWEQGYLWHLYSNKILILHDLIMTAPMALEYLFYVLILNEGKILTIIIVLLLLSATRMGHFGKGGWGCFAPSLSQLPGGPVSHNAIFCSPPVSQPGEATLAIHRVWLELYSK